MDSPTARTCCIGITIITSIAPFITQDPLANLAQIEADLWNAADNLRANSKLTASEYCMPVLGVIFLRHASNRYTEALMNGASLNVAGALLFAKAPQFRLPAFIVKAVAFPGNAIEDQRYLDSRDISGKLSDVFQQTLGFVVSNLRAPQGGITLEKWTWCAAG